MLGNLWRASRLSWLVAILIVIVIITIWARLDRKADITVAIVTRLESGSVVGSSEINAALYFLENHPDCRINIQKLDDKWEPALSREIVLSKIQSGTQFFILSTPSNAALASLEFFGINAGARALNINTSATSNAMSRLDDFSFRIVPDVTIEQQNIASYIRTLPGQQILVVQDTGNLAYTDPAFETFSQEILRTPDKTVRSVKTRVSDFDLSVLEPAFAEKYDILYVLAGSYQQVIGNIAQFSMQHNPSAPVVLTPWARTPSILQTAGPAAEKIILPSQFPSRFEDQKIQNFLDGFKKRFNYEPYSMGLGVYQAMEILHEAFKKGHRTPDTVKKYLIETKTFQTSLGTVTFDQYGDQISPSHFITNFPREFE